MKKIKVILLFFMLLMPFIFSHQVEAASATKMKQEYINFLKNSISSKKYYKIVNVADDKKPVLFVGNESGVSNGYKENQFFSASVYYFKNGKVKKLGNTTDGYRILEHWTKGGKSYLRTGMSDCISLIYVKNGNLYQKSYWKLGDSSYTLYKNGKFSKEVGNGLSYTQFNKLGKEYKNKGTLAFEKNTQVKKVTGLKVSSPSKGKIKINWNKTSGNGYEVKYSRNSYINSGKVYKKTITKSSTHSYSASGLTKGKRYYVHVRAYRVKKGTKIYGAWSAKKSVVVK